MATINRIVQAVRISGRAFFAKVRNLVLITIDSGLGANASTAKESTVVKSAKRPWPLTPSAKAAVFALSVLSAVAAHSQANIVTLTVAPVPAHAGDVITLQAVVYNAAGNPCGNCGNVEFLDASVQPHLIGTAMLSDSGVGSVLVRFGAGSHSITAFHPTTVYANSSNNVAGNQTSPATVLVVSPPVTSYPTSTTISQSGAAGNYTPAAGATPATGSDTLSVAFTPIDTTDYNNATATTTLIVTTNISPITPTIVWPTPASMTSGAALTSAQLNATAVAGGAPVEGTFVYAPAAGTTPAIGLDTLTVTFTPANSVGYTSTTASVVLTVGDFFKMGCGSSEGCATSLGCGSSANQTLRPGGSLTYTLAVMPTALSALPGPLTFNATGLPPDTTVSFSPSQVPAGSGATNVTITIQDNSPQAANTRSQERWPITLAMLLPVLGILSLRQRVGKLPQLRVRAALGTLCLGAILGLTGCGGFAINSPKCYTVVVTAQCGALQHTAETMIKVEN
jgi:hypothetical protein